MSNPSTEPNSETDLPLPPLRTVLAKGGAALGVLVLGFFTMRVLSGMAGEAQRAPGEATKTPVEIMELESRPATARVQATGTVVAAQQVTLVPEVGGKVVDTASALMPGGRLRKGEALVRIDPRNYRTLVAAETARLRQAELELELEKARGEVARREWEILGEEARSGRNPDLALRRPNLAVVEAQVDSAKAALEKARLDLSRTELSVPFNALIVTENVDIGQVVGSGSQLATLVGTDRFWVSASLPAERLDAVDFPGVLRSDGTVPDLGSVATVSWTQSDGQKKSRKAQVISRGGQLDPQTRNATVLLSIESPLDPPAGEPLIYPGTFVDVEIWGRDLPGTFSIPRVALRDGRNVWVVGADDKLEMRTVQVSWTLPDAVLIGDGLQAGDRVVLTPLSAPLVGQAVSPKPVGQEG